jgi:hypothetical protein
MRSFGILRRVQRQFRIDVSEQPISPKFKGQTFHLGRLDLEYGNDTLSRNVHMLLPFCIA